MLVPKEKISRLTGLARRAVEKRLLKERDALFAQEQANLHKISFLTYLFHNRKIPQGLLAKLASDEFCIPLVDLDSFDLQTIPYPLLDEKLVRQHQILPVREKESKLFVAVFDPTNLQALHEIRFHTGLMVELLLVEQNKLVRAIKKVFVPSRDEKPPFKDETSGLFEIGENDAPIVRFVNKILLNAIRDGASDIHFEPDEGKYRVRYRLDGVLRQMMQVSALDAAPICSRIKIMARLDISERRLPQDGRIKLTISKENAIDFRVSTCPTLLGEKVVLRVLDPSKLNQDLSSLGFTPIQETEFLKAITQPQGLILVTGPTGSGKTVSLYTAICHLNTEERNIFTVEDPIEICLPGVNQVNVNLKAGLTFGVALRAFLRQDPDIMMVGEIRDKETADITVHAAQTGHLVLSTLHTNSAPETLTRLINMGVLPFNIASSVSLVIAQRLVRVLCVDCKRTTSLPRQVLIEQGFRDTEVRDLVIYQAVGCSKCYQGYRGRLGIYQVVPIEDEIRRLIMNKGNAIDIADLAKKLGFADLKQAGREKVKAGVTTLEEINRVTCY